MYIHQLHTLDAYVKLLHRSTHEVSVLFQELLINVTSFCGEPEAFELLKKRVLPELLRQKTDDQHLRVWDPGCSIGEEVYSLVMILTECMETLGQHLLVQVFATDLDEYAIQKARKGL